MRNENFHLVEPVCGDCSVLTKWTTVYKTIGLVCIKFGLDVHKGELCRNLS